MREFETLQFDHEKVLDLLVKTAVRDARVYSESLSLDRPSFVPVNMSSTCDDVRLEIQS